MTDTPSDTVNRGAPRRLRRGVLVVLLLVVTWVAAIVVLGLSIINDADSARERLASTRADLEVTALLDGSASADLVAIRDELVSLDDVADNILLQPLRIVPGVGRHIRSADALGSSGVEALDIGIRLLDEMEAVLEGPLPSGQERVATVDRMIDLLDEAGNDLAALDFGPDGPLLAALGDVRDDAVERRDELVSYLGRASTIARSVRDLMTSGPHLLLAANNAEMRSGSGMFLQVGSLDADAGSLDLTAIEPAGQIILPVGAVAAESATYDEIWGYLEPTQEWRNLAASPRFDVTAELATRMWASLGNERPTTVLAIDPIALAAILGAVDQPLAIDGREISADETVEYLTNGQYDTVVDDESLTQDDRREGLGDFADAAFAALDEPGLDPVALFEGLHAAVRGRHLLAWSQDPSTMEGWRAAGMSGELASDSLMVSILNRGANKLDPFLRVLADVSIGEVDGDQRAITIDVELRNRVGPGEVPYVAGPVPGVELTDEYGDYAGILALSLPGVAKNARIEGIDQLQVAHADGPIVALGTEFVVDARTSKSFRVMFTVPADLESVRLEASARLDPVRWRIGDRFFADGEARRVPIG